MREIGKIQLILLHEIYTGDQKEENKIQGVSECGLEQGFEDLSNSSWKDSIGHPS